jgi:hypothetical protein
MSVPGPLALRGEPAVGTSATSSVDGLSTLHLQNATCSAGTCINCGECHGFTSNYPFVALSPQIELGF